ncbi:MAG: histidine kinase, partial [Bacteroidetes bacterium]|nr:histidine kinase [Bacteroidota bacterium]
FKPYKYNNKLDQYFITVKSTNNIHEIYFKKNGDLHLLTNTHSGHITVKPNGSITSTSNWLTESSSDLNNTALQIYFDENKPYSTLNKSKSNKNTSLEWLEKGHPYVIEKKIQDHAYAFSIKDFKKEKSGYTVLCNNTIIRRKGNTFYHVIIPANSLCLYIAQNKILVGTFNGVFEYNLELKQTNHFLQDQIVSKIFQDKVGSLWFSTIENGLFFSQNLNLNKFLIFDKVTPSKLFFNGSNLAIVDMNKKKLALLNTDSKKLVKLFSPVYMNSENIGSTIPEMNKYLDPSSKYHWTVNKPGVQNNYYLSLPHPYIDYFVYNKGIKGIKGKKIRSVDSPFLGINYINCCAKISNDQLLVGTEKGVYLFNINASKTSFDNHEKLESIPSLNIFKMVRFENEILLLTSEGIWIYKVKEQLFSKIKTNLNVSNLREISVESKDAAWLYDYNRVYKIKMQNSSYELTNYTHRLVIDDSRLLSIAVKNDVIYFGTTSGLYFLREKFMENPYRNLKADFKIDSVQISSKFVKTQKQIPSTLYINENFTVYYSLIRFDHYRTFQFEYTIDGKKWLEGNPNSLSLNFQNPGNYKIQIRLKEKPAQILYSFTLNIKKPFVQTIWFYCIEFSLVILIFIAIFKWYLVITNRKKSKELDQLKLELKLLTSSMNPHFTFNTINS